MANAAYKRRVELITISDTSDTEATNQSENKVKQIKTENEVTVELTVSSAQEQSVTQDAASKNESSSLLVFHSGIPTGSTHGTYSLEDGLKEAEEYITNYIDTLKQQCKVYNILSETMETKIKQLIDRIKQNNCKFLRDSFFKNLIRTFQNDLKRVESGADLKSRNYELMVELARFTVQPKKVDGDEKKVKKKVKQLTLSMLKIQDRIAEAEGKCLSLDDMEHHTEYTKLPRLYNTALLLWRQREKLLSRSLNTGRDVFKKLVSYQGTLNSEVNKIVEEVFNTYLSELLRQEEIVLVSRRKSKIRKDHNQFQHFAFFTIIDLKTKLTEKIENQKIDFPLTDTILSKIYRDLAKEFKHRRLSNYNDIIRTFEFLHDLRPDVMANEEKDPNLKNILDESEKDFKSKLQGLMADFKQKDIETYGPIKLDQTKQLGWDDDNKEEEESSEENDEESEDSESD